MKTITIDFETYYSKDVGFSKLTTEEYVRHPEFHVIGVGVQVDDGEPVWYTGSHRKIQKALDKYEMHKHAVVAHNAMFDMAVLNWHFGIRPKRIIDTLSMARALHGTNVGGSLKALAEMYKLGVKGTEVVDAKGLRLEDFPPEQLAAYGEYCCNDVFLTYQLLLKMIPRFPLDELKLVDITIRMFTEPKLELDIDILLHHLDSVVEKKRKLMEGLDVSREVLNSNPKFADLLRYYRITPPMKVSPTTGKQTYAFSKTDEEFVALLDYPDPEVQAIVAARLGMRSTLEETRTQRLIGISERGLLPIPLRYYAAHTGRWGGADGINMQNLPRGSKLKYAVWAPAGYVLCDVDSSQIEARMLAWMAGQWDLVEIFEKNNEEIAAGVPKSLHQYDPYKIMAAKIYNKPMNAITDNERFVGKMTILGCGYGMGAAKFQSQLKNFKVDLALEECEHIVNVYRSTYPRIPELWKQGKQVIMAIIGNRTCPFGMPGVVDVEGTKGVRLPNGLHLQYPNLRMEETTDGIQFFYDTKQGRNTVATKIYGGKFVENVIQALARIVIGEQMIRINRKYPVVMTVHDAVGALIPETEADTGLEFIQMCMRLRPSWAPDLPLNCEGGYGKSYGDCK